MCVGIWKCDACRKTMAGACSSAFLTPASELPQRAALRRLAGRWHPKRRTLTFLRGVFVSGGAYSLNTGGAATVRGTIRRLREAVDL